MKSLVTRNLRLTAVAACLCALTASAQRGTERGQASSRSFDRPSSQISRNESRLDRTPSGSGMSRTERQNSDNGFGRQRTPMQAPPVIGGQSTQRNDGRSSSRNFDRDRSSGYNSGQTGSRPNRNVTVINNNNTNINRVNSQSRNYSYNRGNYNRGYNYGYNNYNRSRYSYTPRRYVYVGAPRYSILPRGAISIHFGGYPYYYHSGGFFSYYSGYYEPVFAPIGIRVNILPVGYWPFYVGNTHYYYYDGAYYTNYKNSTDEYEVVDAPMGAVVTSLPKKTTLALVNGEKFYEFNGTYYKESVNEKGKTIYTVVGKYGEINNTANETDETVPVVSSKTYSVGDVVTSLPEGATVATINGEKLFVTPDNYYFKELVVNNEVNYKVVGVPGDK